MGHDHFSKRGGGPGFNSNIRIYRGSGLATVYLSNRLDVSESSIQDFSDELDSNFIETSRRESNDPQR